MTERLLEVCIYGLSFTIGLILIWVIFRELLRNFKESESESRAQMVKDLFREWLHGDQKQNQMTLEKLKGMGPVPYLESYFFEFFDMSSKEEKHRLQSLFELLGIQERLRQMLKESPHIDQREEAILKLSRVGITEDLPFLLGIFQIGEEDERVKQCVIEAIYELSEPLLTEEDAVQNFGLLVGLLEVPNTKLQDHLIQVLSTTSMPIEDIIPHFLRLHADSAKEGFIKIAKAWNRMELAPLLHDFVDDFNATIRQKAIELLGIWRDETAIILMFKHLDDPEIPVRVATIEALSHFRKPMVRKRLLDRIKDPSIQVQAKIFWVLAIQREERVFLTLIQRLKSVEFRKEFFIQLSHEKRRYLDDFFNFLGLDSRIFFKRFGWGDFNHCEDAFVMTAKESQEPTLRKRALDALSMWGGENFSQLLKEVMASDPDPTVQDCAKRLWSESKKKEVSR